MQCLLSTHFLPSQENGEDPILCSSFSQQGEALEPRGGGGRGGTELGLRGGLPAVVSSPGSSLALILFQEDYQAPLLTHFSSFHTKKSFCA